MPTGRKVGIATHNNMTRWIKMPLGMEVGLGPGDFVLPPTPQLPPLQKGAEPPSRIFDPCPLWPNGWMDQDGTWHGAGSWSRCARWGPRFPPHFYCGHTVGCIKMPLDMEVGQATFCLMGSLGTQPPLSKRGAEPPIFGPCLS